MAAAKKKCKRSRLLFLHIFFFDSLKLGVEKRSLECCSLQDEMLIISEAFIAARYLVITQSYCFGSVYVLLA